MTLDRARQFVDAMVRSPANYWAALACDLAGAVALVAIGARAFTGPAAAGVALAVSGLLGWTFLEYGLHRWIMHGPPSLARVGHARHHADPAALISAPLFLVLLVAFGLWGLLQAALPAGVAALVVGGLYAGYNLYTWVHHVEHRWVRVVARVAPLRRHERLHDVHHVRQDVNFGVSTLVWDRLLGTYDAGEVTRRRASANASRARRDRSAAGADAGPAPRAESRTPSSATRDARHDPASPPAPYAESAIPSSGRRASSGG